MSLEGTLRLRVHIQQHVIWVESVSIRQLVIWSAGVAVVVCGHPSSLGGEA